VTTVSGISTAVPADNRSWQSALPGLMVRYQKGDAKAVEELVRLVSPGLLRFFSAWGLQRADTEDLAQECWVRIHRSRHTYRAPEPVLPWMFAIARHTRLDSYRRRKRREAKEVLVSEPPEILTRVEQPPTRIQDQLAGLLESLPESQREVILMLKMSEMTLEEVARATSSTIGSVKQKAHRAYAKLRKLLQEGA
jgi:RNA polymerase sigma-70 factor, ECF subfamily